MAGKLLRPVICYYQVGMWLQRSTVPSARTTRRTTAPSA